MSLQRFEGTSWVDAGGARKSMSLDGNLITHGHVNFATPSTAEVQLASITLPRNLLNTPDKGLYFFIFGQTAANGNNKQLKLYLGTSISGTLLADTGAVAGNATGVITECWIYPADAINSQIFVISQSQIGTTVASQVHTLTVNPVDALLNFVISGTTATAGGDLTLVGYRVNLLTEGGVRTAGGLMQ